MCDILVTHNRFRRKRKKVNNGIKTKAIVLAMCTVVLVAMSALASAGGKPENIADGVTTDERDSSKTENGTEVTGWGNDIPNLEITDKKVLPYSINQGEEGILYLTISEVDGNDNAMYTKIYLEIINADGCCFSEDNRTKAYIYLGPIYKSDSVERALKLKVPSYAPPGERTINITVEYDDYYGILPWGHYSKYADVDFTVTPTPTPTPEPTSVSVTPSAQTVSQGSPFTATIIVDPKVSIAGVQFDLSFDPSLVSVDSVTEGDLLTQGGADTYFSQGTIDNPAGTITGLSGAITTPGETVSSSGVFTTIQMTAKSVEGTSTLNLSNVIVGDLSGNPVTITVNAGNVTVTPCADDWDVNGDGHVNVLDMIRVGQHWGETGGPHWIREDVNKDGNVNVLDIIVIGQHWTG